MLLVGITLASVGTAFFLLDIYRNSPEIPWWIDFISLVALRPFPRSVRILVFGSLGIGFFGFGLWGLNRAIMAPYLRPGRSVVDTLANYRQLKRGAKIVVLGGGTGQSTLLRGLKRYTKNLTAVVTVADDGGSSGRLRRTMGILPPGDIRNCLAALSDDEELITQLFQYRFSQADGSGGLEGHSFGNLFLSAMSEISGSFEGAIAESGRVLAVNGRVMPATLENVNLVAEVLLENADKRIQVIGESQIPEAGGAIQRVWLEPDAPPAYPRVIQAILSADMIVVGPGSLFTSLLPNLLVPEIAAALKSSSALRVFVCNVANQAGETMGFSCGDYLQALENHLGEHLFDLVVCHRESVFVRLPDEIERVNVEAETRAQYPLYFGDVANDDKPWLHDSDKLAQVLIDLYQHRTGPLTL